MTHENNFLETADIETSSEDYARRFSGAVGDWFLKVQEEATLKMLSSCPKASVLDVGGGHGQMTESLIKEGFKVTVLGSTDICKDRIQRFLDQGSCSFQVGNILKLPYPDQTFDVVLSFRLLPHVVQWNKLIQELCRVSKKCVVIDYPEIQSINSIAPLLFKFKKRLEGNTRSYTCFKKQQLEKFFELQDFSLKSRFPEFFFPMVLHRVLKLPNFSGFLERCARFLGLTTLLGSPVILKFIRENKS